MLISVDPFFCTCSLFSTPLSSHLTVRVFVEGVITKPVVWDGATDREIRKYKCSQYLYECT